MGNISLVTQLSEESEPFLEQRVCCCRIAMGHKEHSGQSEERVSDAPLVPRYPVHRQTLLEQDTCAGVLPLVAHKLPQVEERPSDAVLVVYLSEECQGLLCSHACRGR